MLSPSNRYFLLRSMPPRVGLCLLLAVGPTACGDDDDNDALTDAGLQSDGGTQTCEPTETPDPGTCEALATDYRPDQDDMWAPCVSDPGQYVRIQPTISTIARVGGFEEIAALLFDPARDADPDTFLQARTIYQEDEGLDSRVVRRFDPHFEVPDGTNCTNPGVPEQFPDYCVGPGQLQPILLDAFREGAEGTEPRTNAGRIEAALLWFLYASTYKESFTCTSTAKDCDSAYAYYTGGEPARCGLGLARYVEQVDPYAHDRAWDGLLAVRCWRDLDADEVATQLELRDRARTQYDRAVLDGVAAIVRARLELLATTSGDEQSYQHAFVQVLGQALDRAMTDADPDSAQALRQELAKTDPAEVDGPAAIAAIDRVFDCP